jgi:hypothetical protein
MLREFGPDSLDEQVKLHQQDPSIPHPGDPNVEWKGPARDAFWRDCEAREEQWRKKNDAKRKSEADACLGEEEARQGKRAEDGGSEKS